MVSPLDEVDIVKSTWADESAVCAIHRHLPGLSSRNRINAGQQDGASAPTNPTRTVVGWNRINVGQQDGASAPTHHPHSPRPYAEFLYKPTCRYMVIILVHLVMMGAG